MENNKNFIIAIVLSLAVLLGWQFFYMRPLQKKIAEQQAIEAQKTPAKDATASSQQTPTQVEMTAGSETYANRDAAIAASTQRVKFQSKALLGSINLKGGRIDDVTLTKYTQTVDPNSLNVALLSPSGSPHPFFATLGWANADTAAGVTLPGDKTVWQQENTGDLTPSTPVTLKYDTGAGLIFHRKISIDDNYMFTIADEVENNSAQTVNLRPYGQIARLTKPEIFGYSVVHEGLIGFIGGQGNVEKTYDKALKNYDAQRGQALETYSGQGGWVGFTDQYWAAVLVPDPSKSYSADLFGNDKGQYYSQYSYQAVTIAPNSKVSIDAHLFAGAKEISLLDDYENTYHIDRLSQLVDWGWFPFLTYPMSLLMSKLYGLVGNFGVAIMLTTVLIKLILFPLANKAYASMSRMKLLQPEIKKIQERFKDDPQRQRTAMMEYYKKEKINPMAGCLPIFIQIPIFFSLYKVLLINIQMRHAPFIGYIHDLSAPDPTTIFNLFGLIHWAPPSFLMFGLLPLAMGLSMWIQMRLNPTPTDPIQQQVMTFMPLIFTFMMKGSPAGLLVYWTWNNLLSFTQQAIIMKRQGAEIDISHNMGLKRLNKRRQQLQSRLKDQAARRPRSPAE